MNASPFYSFFIVQQDVARATTK